MLWGILRSVSQEEVVLREEKCLPTTDIYKCSSKASKAGAYLPRGTDQGTPLDLRHKSPKKFWIKVRLSDLNLGIFECQREVIRCTSLHMTSQQVVRDEPNHLWLPSWYRLRARTQLDMWPVFPTCDLDRLLSVPMTIYRLVCLLSHFITN